MNDEFNKTEVNNSLRLPFLEDLNNDYETDSKYVTNVILGVSFSIIFIILIALMIQTMKKKRQESDVKKKRKRYTQFIGAIYRKSSETSQISNVSKASNPPESPMAFDNPTYASSPSKKKKTDEIEFQCELIDNMDEINLNDDVNNSTVDIIMAEVDENDLTDEILGHRRSFSWS